MLSMQHSSKKKKQNIIFTFLVVSTLNLRYIVSTGFLCVDIAFVESMSDQKMIIIDCDPGLDDACALLMALAAPNISLLAITTCHGNASVDQVSRNALRILHAAGRLDVSIPHIIVDQAYQVFYPRTTKQLLSLSHDEIGQSPTSLICYLN